MKRRRAWNSTLPLPTEGLHRTAELQRHGFLRAVNPERKKRRREAGEVYGDGYVWMAKQTCEERGNAGHLCCYSARRFHEAHHIKHVGAGGKDADNLIPTCHALHDEFHSGKTLADMERKYHKDYRARARYWWARYQANEEAA